jgi:hypothetical protein
MSIMEAIILPRVLDSLHMKGDDVRRTCRIANCKMQGIKSPCDNIMMLNWEQASIFKADERLRGITRMNKATGILRQDKSLNLFSAPQPQSILTSIRGLWKIH